MFFSEIVINENFPGINPVSFGHEVCAPSHSFGPAVREYYLIHYVISGHGRFVREGQEYFISPGQAFVIPPHLETYYQADHKDPWHYIWIGFTAPESLCEFFSPPVLHTRGIGEVFETMRTSHDLERGRSAFLAARVWDLLALLQEKKPHSVGYIDKAIHCMHAEYMTDLNVAVLAARLGLDRSYFSTLFKSEVGVSPGRYLSNLRLSKAAELMRDFHQSPSTAAVSSGFPDLYHFSKAFKQKYGHSPREYKKRCE